MFCHSPPFCIKAAHNDLQLTTPPRPVHFPVPFYRRRNKPKSCTHLRRHDQIVQYIDLIRQDNGSSTLPYGASWASTGGDHFPWISASQFSEDAAGGHGTHTAGSAAGATISFPVVTEDCTDGREVSCVGGCIDADAVFAGDDLLSSWESFYTNLPFAPVDLDRLCPRYDCDGVDETFCLGNDAGVTLAEHGGIARGAKLAIFDVLDHFGAIGIELAGNGIWEPAMEAGSKLHSSSWGGLNECRYLPMDVLHDSFMYNVRAERIISCNGVLAK